LSQEHMLVSQVTDQTSWVCQAKARRNKPSSLCPLITLQ